MPVIKNILFDVETYAIDRVGEFLDKPTAPSNYKNPETIERYVEDAWQRLVAKAALKPDLGRIVCVSWLQDDRDTEPRVITCKDEHEERYALTEFWDDLTEGDVYKRTIGFNSHRFDLPFLMRRSLALGVEYVPVRVDRNSPHLDLLRLLTFDDVIDGYSLQFYLRRYNLDVAGIDDEMTGADIAELVKAGDWDAVAHHCKCDVLRLAVLATFMRAINVRIEKEQPF